MGCALGKGEESARGSLDALSGSRPRGRLDNEAQTLRVKLVLLGDSGVGKSCIVMRFVRGQFDPSSKVTVGAAFLSQAVALPDMPTVKFEIWDTAGQERYASLAPLYYRGASAAIVAYDITSRESFAKAHFWVKELQKHGGPGLIIALVGNKVDLADKRKVSLEDAEAYAGVNASLYMETSAKTSQGVQPLFEQIARMLLQAAGTGAPTAAQPVVGRAG
eukprot:jgi/Mesvir1/25385/Mv01425-RA.1